MEFINDNANIFFFVTTIFVTILIFISLLVFFIVFKLYKFINKLIRSGDEIIEKNKDNIFIQKGLPFVLPILSFFLKKKGNKQKNK